MHIKHLPSYTVLGLLAFVLFVLPVLPFTFVKTSTPSSSVLGTKSYKINNFNITEQTANSLNFTVSIDPRSQVVLELPLGFFGNTVYFEDTAGIFSRIENGVLYIVNTSDSSKLVKGILL